MGKNIYTELKDKYEILGFDKDNSNDLDKLINEMPDIIIDFTNYEISKEIIKKAISKKIDIISGTTGYNDTEIKSFYNMALKNNTLFYWSPNYSLGYNFLVTLVKNANELYDKCDIIEIHNNTKHDKPSGTALKLAKIINYDKNKINSLRLIEENATHCIVFYNEFEKLIITHEVSDKKAFLEGFMNKFKEMIENRKEMIQNYENS